MHIILEVDTSSWGKEKSPSGYPILIEVTSVEISWQRFYVRPISVEMHGKSCDGFDRAEQGHGADCLQRPLVPRSRFRQRLMPSVGLTARCGDGVHIVSKP